MTDDTPADDGDASRDAAADSSSGSALSLDTILEVLSNRRRRFALYALVGDPDGVVALDALVEDVTTLDAALEREALTQDRYLEIATDLYHWHLPVLADIGLVDCDARQETIRYRRHPALETWIERALREDLARETHQ